MMKPKQLIGRRRSWVVEQHDGIQWVFRGRKYTRDEAQQFAAYRRKLTRDKVRIRTEVV